MDLAAAMEFLAAHQQQMLDLTIQLAEINSGTFNLVGIKRVAAIMQTEMATLGCEHVSMPVAPYRVLNAHGGKEERPLGPVLRFWKRPQAAIQVLLMGHLDTVYDVGHSLQHTSKVGGDLLAGPGVTDMKGGLAVLLWALKAFEQLPQAQNIGWEVLLNADEEIGSPGSAEIIAQRAKQHQVGFLFEPAMDEHGTLAGARKGSGNFTVVIRGKSAHAGRNFADGRNAICKMAEFISKINAMNKQRPEVTLNIGFVQGGEALNVVPDCCICRLNIRIGTMEDAIWISNTFDNMVNEVNKTGDYHVEIIGGFHRQPKLLDDKTLQLYKLVQVVGNKMGLEIKWQSSGGCSDGNNLAAVGLPNIDTLGVHGGRIHSQQEFMLIASLLKRAQLFTQILVYLSENGLNNGT